MSILIRKATNADSSLIGELIFDIWLNEYHFAVKKEDFPDLQKIETYYPSNNSLFLVAIENNNIVGTIACSQLTMDQWVLKRMFVKKSHRRLGIAQSLLNQLLNDLFNLTKNPQISLFLSTNENEATAAKTFYLKNNFQIISKSSLPSTFPYFYEDDLFMMRNHLRI